MKKLIAAFALLVVVGASSVEAQLPGGRPGAARPGPARGKILQEGPARREALEAQVLNRFVNRASTDMSLDAGGRTKLNEIVRASAQRRRGLNQRTMELHRRFAEAMRSADTPPATFTKLLTDHEALRREEQQIADSEKTELQKFLTPRQQAQFLMLWIRLQENARAIQAQQRPLPDGGQ